MAQDIHITSTAGADTVRYTIPDDVLAAYMLIGAYRDQPELQNALLEFLRQTSTADVEVLRAMGTNSPVLFGVEINGVNFVIDSRNKS